MEKDGLLELEFVCPEHLAGRNVKENLKRLNCVIQRPALCGKFGHNGHYVIGNAEEVHKFGQENVSSAVLVSTAATDLPD